MAILVRHLRKTFGDHTALDDVSLDFGSGELVALIGPSGCGKTTLLRVIAGLETADAGEVVLHGRNVSALDARARQVGFVFQHYALFRHMTVFDNVAFGLRVKPRGERPSEAAIREKVRELLTRVQLDTLAHRYPAELSGGQRQRIALARALAVDPKVLLLDEPFGALDAKVRKELRAWLRRLHDELAISTLFVTHDQEEALDVADRIVVMNHGRVEQTGTPQAVYDAPATPFVYSFLGATNRFEGRMAPDGFILDGPQQSQGQRGLSDAGVSAARGSGAAYAYARPHELALHRQGTGPADGIRADVRRVIVRGASVRVELSAASGAIEAEMDRGAWQALALAEGDGVTVVPRALRVFEAG